MAAAYNVPVATMRSWKSRAGIVGGGAAPLIAPEARAEVGALLLGYLAELLGALRKQTVVMGDETWLRKQSAGELAVLHGAGVDRAILLLEALEGPEADAESDAGVVEMQDVAGVLS